MDPIYQYVQHHPSGEVYLIKREKYDPEILGACGPLHYNEVTAENLTTGFNDKPGLAEWINTKWGEYPESFRLKEPEE